jgi:hypothetical protein
MAGNQRGAPVTAYGPAIAYGRLTGFRDTTIRRWIAQAETLQLPQDAIYRPEKGEWRKLDELPEHLQAQVKAYVERGLV